jgi:hypothetical protein
MHFLYAREAADYIPSWIPGHLFWMYLTGSALIGAGIAIILKIRIKVIATLLGAMILTWVLILHIPKAIAAPVTDRGGEVFVLAGTGQGGRVISSGQRSPK